MAGIGRALLLILAAATIGSASLPPSARAEIVIDMIASMTGDNATSGAQLQVGAEAAVAEINGRGGVLGEKLALNIVDDGCETRRAVSIANKVIADNVSFVLGPWCSQVTLPISSTLAESGMIEMVLASIDQVTEQGFDGLFKLNGRNDRQSKLLADFVAKHHSGERVALVADRSAYAISLMAALRRYLQETGGVTIVLDQSIDAGTKNFGPLISGFKNAAADIVVYIGFPTDLGLIMAQTEAAGVKLPFASTNTMASRKIWDLAGKAASGMAFSCKLAVELLPTAQDIVGSLKAKGKDSSGFTLYAYVGVQLLTEAIAQAKSTRADAVAAELQTSTFKTAMGDLSFDEKGDLVQPIWRMCRWGEGSYGYYQGE
jgi:branched-chain amino acid transport system substrate-binding protein